MSGKEIRRDVCMFEREAGYKLREGFPRDSLAVIRKKEVKWISGGSTFQEEGKAGIKGLRHKGVAVIKDHLRGLIIEGRQLEANWSGLPWWFSG